MFDFSPEGNEGVRQPFAIPLPFLRQTIGSGDVVKQVTDALRIPQCGGCKERQDKMNGAVEFRPMRPWDV
jgi:hypothetical protein